MNDTEKTALERRIDELCEQVERLHGEIRLNPLECALSEEQALRGQVSALQAENAKLRELALEMYEDQCCDGDQWKYRDRARELGVEVPS